MNLFGNAIRQWYGTLSIGTPGGGSLAINSAGNVTIGSPLTGVALASTGVSNAFAALFTGSATNGQSYGLAVVAGTTSADSALIVNNKANVATFLSIYGDGHGTLGPSATSGISWTTAGNVTINAPSSGTTLGVASNTSQAFIATSAFAGGVGNVFQNTNGGTGSFVENKLVNDVNAVLSCVISSSTFSGTLLTGAPAGKLAGLYTGSAYAIALAPNGATSVLLDTSGNVNVPNGAGTLSPVYAGIPQNLQVGATYTAVLTDANKHIAQGAGGTHTYTIPANASVPYPIGTAITIINSVGVGNLTLNITSDTLTWCPSGATGTRTLAAGAVVTLLKIAATVWYMTGVGIT